MAPPEVYFFGTRFVCFTSRDRHAKIVSEISGIPPKYLARQSIRKRKPVDVSRASVADRMIWASSRHATRKEDLSYSLLGLFGVHMPLLYGEEDEAFQRLQIEIIGKSADESIFAWPCTDAKQGFLAPHIRVFSDHEVCVELVEDAEYSGEFVQSEQVPRQHYEVTNKGVRMLLPLPQQQLVTMFKNCSHVDVLVLLNCLRIWGINSESEVRRHLCVSATIRRGDFWTMRDRFHYLIGRRTGLKSLTDAQVKEGCYTETGRETGIFVNGRNNGDIEIPVYFAPDW